MIKRILSSVKKGKQLENNGIIRLFSAKKPDDIEAITKTAFEIREDSGKRITLTSTIHLTNICSVTPKCKYCGFAAGTSPSGYYYPFVKSDSEILQAAMIIEQSGIPRVSCSGAHGYDGTHAVNAAKIVKKNSSLNLLVNVGSDLTQEACNELWECGTDTVCCNLETTNETLFKSVKPGETLNKRIYTCNLISKSGLELSSGLLIGMGESYADRLHHLKFLRVFHSLGEIPIMGFNPYKGTPMEDHPACSIQDQILTVAITRILFPDIRITVPTPTIGPENIRFPLLAGADNIATVIPDSYPHGIKGVGSPTCGTLNGVLEVIKKMGLKLEPNLSMRSCKQDIPACT